MSFPGLSSLTGGGGLSASSSASTGPLKGGDIGGSSFGGINTGSQSSVPGWVYPVALGFAAIVAILYFRRR